MSDRKKIVVLSSRVPFPLEKGDKLRIYHQMKQFAVNNDVFLISISSEKIVPGAIEELESFCKEVHVYDSKKSSVFYNLFVSLVGKLPFQVGYFFNAGAHYHIKQLINKIQPDHIFVQLVRMAEYVKSEKSFTKSLDYMDSFSKGMQRRAEKEKSWKSMLFSLEHQRLKKYEEEIYKRFDHHFIISEQDRDSFEFEEAKNIAISPNGLDQEFFKAKEGVEKTHDIVFTGNMSYPPNVAAAEFLAKEVLPLLVGEFPNCKILIAGASPSSNVKTLASKNVEITGWVDDIRDSYACGKVFVAPLNIGTGLQNKLLEAMSMKLPCVTSELANNALNAKDGEQVLIAKSPQEYADHIIKLLRNTKFANEIALAGQQYVHNNYDWKTMVNEMEAIMFQEND